MVAFTGWINIVFIILMGSLYPLRIIYTKLAKKRGRKNVEGLGKLYRFFKNTHPILGGIILLLGSYHGATALSLTVFRTGTVLFYLILAMGVIALVGPRVKPFKKHWRLVHRALSPLVFLFAVLHVFWRNIF